MSELNTETRVEQLVEQKVEAALAERDARIQELEEELEEERQERQRLEQRVEQREEIVELREPENGGEPDLSNVWAVGEPLGEKLLGIGRCLEWLENKIEERQADETPQAADEMDAEAPPLYDVLRAPESSLEPTERRTRFLWNDLTDYASKTPAGYVLPASDVRRVLEAAEPEESEANRIRSKHVGRVFALSEDLTRGAAYVRKEGRERQLVVPTGWEEEARAAAPDSVVS